MEGIEVPAVVLAVDTPAATDAHEVTEEEDKGDRLGPFVRGELAGLALVCEADQGQIIDGWPASDHYLTEPYDKFVEAVGTEEDD